MTDGKQFAFYRVDKNDPDVEYLKAYYGLSDDFPFEQLICQNQEMNKLYFISKEVSDFLYSDPSRSLNLINIGVLLF